MGSAALYTTPESLLKRGEYLGAIAERTMPKPPGKKILIKTDGDTKDIIKAIDTLYNEYWEQCKDLAKNIKGATTEESLKNIWSLVRTNIQYDEDLNDQYPQSPAATWQSKKGDCKSFSILIASLCRCLNIPCAFRYVNYRPGEQFSHVYVVARCCCGKVRVLDCCMNDYNKETKFYSYKDSMNVYMINGISGNENQIEDTFIELQGHIDNKDLPIGLRNLLSDARDAAQELKDFSNNADYLNAVSVLVDAGFYNCRKFKNPQDEKMLANLAQVRKDFASILVRAKLKQLDIPTTRVALRQCLATYPTAVQQYYVSLIKLLRLSDYFYGRTMPDKTKNCLFPPSIRILGLSRSAISCVANTTGIGADILNTALDTASSLIPGGSAALSTANSLGLKDAINLVSSWFSGSSTPAYRKDPRYPAEFAETVFYHRAWGWNSNPANNYEYKFRTGVMSDEDMTKMGDWGAQQKIEGKASADPIYLTLSNPALGINPNQYWGDIVLDYAKKTGDKDKALQMAKFFRNHATTIRINEAPVIASLDKAIATIPNLVIPSPTSSISPTSPTSSTSSTETKTAGFGKWGLVAVGAALVGGLLWFGTSHSASTKKSSSGISGTRKRYKYHHAGRKRKFKKYKR